MLSFGSTLTGTSSENFTMKNKTFLTVDSGMNTGWAYWVDGELINYGQVTIKHAQLASDISSMISKVRDVVLAYPDLDAAYLEYPHAWAGSATSEAASASGDLIKLGALVGVVATVIECYTSAKCSYILPYKWKGQLGKDAIKFRVARALGVDERSSHINDAIGIGLHVLGKLKIPNESKPFR